MADPQHVAWLRESVDAWNKRRSRESFTPDFTNSDLRDANLEQADLHRADFGGANLSGANLAAANLSGANLSEVELAGAQLTSANLRWADLGDAILSGANFAKADLTKANLGTANLARANFSDADLSHANLGAANLMSANFRNADLSHANLSNSNLSDSNLSHATISYADLRSGVLQGADLTSSFVVGSDLMDVNLRAANLRGATLSKAILMGADLSDAKFGGTILNDADLRGANFEGTDFKEVQLIDAIVRSSRQTGGTNLSGVRGLSQAQVNQMQGDTGVVLPEGVVHSDEWPAWKTQGKHGQLFTGRGSKWDGERDTGMVADRVSSATVKSHLEFNRDTVVLISRSILEQIAEYREQIRRDNELAASDLDLRDGILTLLDRTSEDINELLLAVPEENEEVSDENAEEVAGWLNRFTGTVTEEFQKYSNPENVGRATVPSAIVLTCAALGAALGWGLGGIAAVNPVGSVAGGYVGFAAGGYFGKLITNNLKPGHADEKLQEILDKEVPGDDPD